MTQTPASNVPRKKLVWRLLMVLLAWTLLGYLAVWAMRGGLDNDQATGGQEVREEMAAGAPQAAKETPDLKLLVGNAPYRFVAMGDWGAGSPMQKDVAAQLNAAYDKKPFDMVLMLGDNIYPDGNVKKWGDAYFTQMYKHLIEKNVHFVVALGNHDVLRGFQKDQKDFFRMPAYYYTVRKHDMDFFILDTNSFGGSAIQQQWLERQLASSKAPWKIVIGHHPVYTSGEHGSSKSLQKTLEPLLVKHKVQLYLAGHDHDYERFKPINGVQHIVSGGAGAYLRDFEDILPQSLVRHKANHFLLFELQGDILGMQAIDKTGKVIDQTSWNLVKKSEKLPKAS